MTDPIEVYAARKLAKQGIDVRAQHREEALIRARRGAYADRQAWQDASPEAKYHAFVRGTVAAMTSDAVVLSHWAAAVMWGLPALSWPSHVDVLVNRRQGNSGLIRRHAVSELPTLAVLDGIAVTSAARTVVDIARSGGFIAGLLAADAALAAQLCTTADLDAEVATISGKGSSVAKRVVELADAGAESPGESLSRAGMYIEGLPQPALQVPVRDADGVIGWCDFGWGERFGEFDGLLKYGLGDEAPAQAVWSEKLREDRIRNVGPFTRWTWICAFRRRPMITRLAAIGVHRDKKAEWHRSPQAEVPARDRRHSSRDGH